METGWLNLQPDQYTKLEEDPQDGLALNLTERLGIPQQLQKQIQQQQQQHQQQQNQQQQQQIQQLQQIQSPQQPQAVAGGKRKRGSTAKERISKMPPCTAGKRSSIYRGVTRHRWTGRYEAHLWDKGTWNHTQNKKGKQGAYDDEEAAARAYDLAALKYWGPGTLINFPVTDYTRDIEEMQNVSREEYLASLRRKSSGFSRGVSKYRGVARHHHNGRWEARIGRVFGNKYLYLGTYSTQEEAATAYDMAAIEYRGLNAVTNFDLSRYIRWLRPGQGSNLPAGQETTDLSNKETVDTSGAEFADEILNQVDQSNKGSSSSAMDNNNNNNNNSSSTSTQVWPSQTTEPYQLPTLGLARAAAQNNSSLQKKSNAPTALGLLLQSNMFRQMLEKTSSTGGSRGMGDESQLGQLSQPGGEHGQQHDAAAGEIEIDGSQFLVGAAEGYGQQAGADVTGGQPSDGYTPFQHDFGLTPGQQAGEQQGGGVGDDQEDPDGAGLSLWSSFGSNFGALPSLATTNAISTC